MLGLVRRVFLATDGTGTSSLRRVVFCGIDEAAGSNLLCARVALTLAEQIQSQVCVVDANIHAQSSSSLLDLLPLDTAPHSPDQDSDGIAQKLTNNLWVVTGDPSRANKAALTLDDLRSWITSHSSEFGHVVISAPPIGLHTDATVLGQIADGVILVLEANSTHWQTARKAKEALESANVRILGTVLNNRTFPIPDKIYRML